MNRQIIYALRDPASGFFRYIGKSSSGLERPRQHETLAKKGRGGAKCKWIRSLLRKGLKYEIVVLEETTRDDLNNRETWWITFYKPFGYLTNISEGGANEVDQRAGARAAAASMTRAQKHARAVAAGKGRTAALAASPELRQRCSEIARATFSAWRKSLTDEQKAALLKHLSDIGKIGGKVRQQQISPEERSRCAKAAWAALTPDEQRARGTKTREALNQPHLKEAQRQHGKRIANLLTPEQRGRAALKVWAGLTPQEQANKIAALVEGSRRLSPESRSRNAKQGWITRRTNLSRSSS